ncbi:Probable receptor-like protein kinase At1g11050 [Linum grandiflorum]
MNFSSSAMVLEVSLSSTILLFLFCSSTAVSSSTPELSCPVNFTYIENYKTHLSPCQQDPFSLRCCWFLRPVVALGFAQYLKESSTFFLPNESYVPSCLSTLSQKLNASAGVDQSAVSLCVKDLSRFVADSSGCDGFVTLQDWKRKVGSTSSMDSSCMGDLNNTETCATCTVAASNVVASLMPDGGGTSCNIFVLMYAAGIVNQYGPFDNRTSFCLMSALRDGLEPEEKQPPKDSSKRRMLELAFGISGGVLLLVSVVLVLLYRKKLHCYRKEPDLDSEHASSSNNPSDMMLAKMGLQWFRLQQLERATDGFSGKNLVGKGTFGVVYKGKIDEDGSIVAVKELLEVECFGNDKDFMNEVEIVSKIKHRNLLPLRGCCVDTKGKTRRLFLVYEFMANGSVADHLLNLTRRVQLCWEQRKNIILDVAKGLVYLHCSVKPAIYHRDIKSSNILLDLDLRAKVADFGLARQGREDGYSHITTRVAGTHGFLAPEYAMYGHLSHKTDVYSFGVLILEIMTARKVIDTCSSDSSSPVLITDWVWDLVKSGKVEDVFDETMKDDYHQEYSDDGEMMTRFVMVGVLCAHVVAAHRPTITEALRMLEGGIDVPKTPERPLLMSR